MTEPFYKKSAGILATVLIGIIILSFMFTGFQTGMGPKTQDTIAQVNGTPIKASEYQRAYEQRLEMYRQMLGGTTLSSQQIAEFKIQDQVLEQLVEQKLVLNYSEKIGLFPASQEIAKLIQGQSYFQENGQFNLQRYKSILAQNRMSPSDYERLMEEELRLNGISQVISYVPVSQKYIQERLTLKEKSPMVHAVRIPKNIFSSLVDVSSEKINTFLKTAENQKKLETYFAARKPSLDKPETVKVRHILLKVTEDRDKEKTKAEALALSKTLTAQNFAQVAKEKSDDPSSKEKGGELPPIQKGTFLPEIENVAFSTAVGAVSKPFSTRYGTHILIVESKQEAKTATLNEYKDQLAKEIIQREDVEGQKKIENETISLFKNILSKSASAAALTDSLKKEQSRFKIQYEVDKSLGLLDDKIGEIALPATDISSILNGGLASGKDFVFNNAAEIIIVYAKEKAGNTEVSTEKKAEDLVKEKSEQMNLLSQYARMNTIKSLRDKAKVKLFAKFN